MYQVCADINNVQLKKVALNEDFSLDKEAIVSACDENTKLLFICSPNNPTSNSYDPEEILDLASKLDLIVVVDEAYIDFSSRQSLKNYIENYSNIVILQTFSKAWALAGIRLGMAIADPEIIQYMSKVKYPYNINMLTINFAMDALDDSHKVKNWIALILKERELLERKLKKYRFVEKVYPSDANFLLVKVAKPKKVYSYLVEKKIIVRDRSNVQLCEGSLRITVGSEKENLELTEAMMNYQRDFVDSCSI
jgi:histidinol-phosphate aminotransferase